MVFELRSSALSRELDRAFARLRACGTAVWRSLNVFWVPKVRKFRLCFHFRRDLGVGSVQKTVRSALWVTSFQVPLHAPGALPWGFAPGALLSSARLSNLRGEIGGLSYLCARQKAAGTLLRSYRPGRNPAFPATLVLNPLLRLNILQHGSLTH